MPVLTLAITKGHWELAALCLLLGLVKAFSKLPPDSVLSLLDVLGGSQDGKEKR